MTYDEMHRVRDALLDAGECELAEIINDDICDFALRGAKIKSLPPKIRYKIARESKTQFDGERIDAIG